MQRSADIERIARPVIALADDYAAGITDPRHSHRRSQLLHATSGVMAVATDRGRYILPCCVRDFDFTQQILPAGNVLFIGRSDHSQSGVARKRILGSLERRNRTFTVSPGVPTRQY